jgi:hypothetical protein
MRPASVNPKGAFGRILTRAQASAAARTCVRSATAAGWSNNAQAGILALASAICVAQSGGQPAVYYCSSSGQDGYYPPVNCPGAYDRGLWQIDSQAWTNVSDSCALQLTVQRRQRLRHQRGRAELRRVGHLHQRGLRELPARRAGGRGCPAGRHGAGRGTRRLPVPPQVRGRCAGGHRRLRQRYPAPAVEDARAGHPGWAALGNGELRNAGSGRCLRDPRASTAVGTPVNVGSCILTAARIWWPP